MRGGREMSGRQGNLTSLRKMVEEMAPTWVTPLVSLVVPSHTDSGPATWLALVTGGASRCHWLNLKNTCALGACPSCCSENPAIAWTEAWVSSLKDERSQGSERSWLSWDLIPQTKQSVNHQTRWRPPRVANPSWPQMTERPAENKRDGPDKYNHPLDPKTCESY